MVVANYSAAQKASAEKFKKQLAAAKPKSSAPSTTPNQGSSSATKFTVNTGSEKSYATAKSSSSSKSSTSSGSAKTAEPKEATTTSTTPNSFTQTSTGLYKSGGKTYSNVSGEMQQVAAGNPPIIGLTGGTAGIIKSTNSAINAVKGSTAVTKAASIGTKGVIQTTLTEAPAFVVNSKTTAQTVSWITNIAQRLKSPKAIASIIGGTIVGAIGSYPFAGFIKEEALQTLGFGVKTALDSGNLEDAQRALDEQNAILDPTLWDELKTKIPYVNVLDSLDDFYSAAKTKVSIDQKIINDLKVQQETGETDTEMYERINTEREKEKEDQRVADEAYYANIAALKKAAKIAERKEDEKYWNDILEKREQDKEKERQAEEDYWSEYYKTLTKTKGSTYKSNYDAPSNLKFGLL